MNVQNENLANVDIQLCVKKEISRYTCKRQMGTVIERTAGPHTRFPNTSKHQCSLSVSLC